jgi:hypothetical protein
VAWLAKWYGEDAKNRRLASTERDVRVALRDGHDAALKIPYIEGATESLASRWPFLKGHEVEVVTVA